MDNLFKRWLQNHISVAPVAYPKRATFHFKRVHFGSLAGYGNSYSLWLCEGAGGQGYGDTPKIAYDACMEYLRGMQQYNGPPIHMPQHDPAALGWFGYAGD